MQKILKEQKQKVSYQLVFTAVNVIYRTKYIYCQQAGM